MWNFSPILEAAASRDQLDSRRNPFHLPQHQPGLPQGSPQTAPSQLSSPLTQCVWTFFWLGIMLFIAIPIGIISCQLYVLLSPISACMPCFTTVTNFILRLAHMPLRCAHNMVQAKPLFSL